MFGTGPGGRITLGSQLTSLRSGHEPAATGPAPALLRALPARHQPLRADRGQLPGETASGRGLPAPTRPRLRGLPPRRARPPLRRDRRDPLQGPARPVPLAGGGRGRPQPDGEDAPPDPARAARAGDPPKAPPAPAQGTAAERPPTPAKTPH